MPLRSIASLRSRRGGLAAGLGALGLALALGACADERLPVSPQARPDVETAPPFTVTIHVPRDTLLVWQSTQLTAALLNPGPDTVFGRPQVEWSTSDTAIVKVDATGLARAVGPGTATITARFAQWDRSATVTITSLAATLRNAAMRKGMRVGVGMDGPPNDSWFPGNAAYVSTMNREFNALQPFSAFAIGHLRWFWPNWWEFSAGDAIVPNTLANGQIMRGGIFQGWLNPPFLVALQPSEIDRDSAIHLLTTHVDSVVGHFRGKVKQWDVVFQALMDETGAHKPASESVWERLIGHDWIELAFQEAAKADPGALLYYSDWALEFPGRKQDSAYAMVAGMQAKGIRVNGVVLGAGGTSGQWMQSPADLKASMARFGALGLRVDLSVTIQLPNPASPTAAELEQQAAEYRQYVQACDEAPSCDTVWFPGVDDGHIGWPPGSAATLFDAGFNKKPAWYAVYNYLAGL